MNVKTSLAALLALTCVTVSHAAQALDKAKLDRYFDRLLEKNKGMGCITIAKDGNPLYSRAFGYAQVDGTTKKPLTESTRFRIASITKAFTAVMILQLVEEGKLKLADALDKFFPQVPNAQRITILHLLWHRSGVPTVTREDATWKPGAAIAKDEMLALIANGTPEFVPDTKTSYSNSGYFLLALILEKVTGESYDRALEERINSRIGLKDTYLAMRRIDVNNGEAQTYVDMGRGWKQNFETHPSIAFQLISTTSDMSRFVQSLFDHKLVSRDSLEQIKTIRDGEGLGIVTFTFAGKTFYGATGGGDNYGSWLAYQPEDKLVVAYLTNAKAHPVKDIISAAIDIYYGKPFDVPTFEAFAVSPEILDKYVGVYSNPGAPNKWTVTRDGATLLVEPGSQGAAAPEATAENRFQLFGGRVVFEFDVAKGQMTIKRGGLTLIFTKE